MRGAKFFWAGLLVVSLCAYPYTSRAADSTLIHDVENLRNSLPLKDPGRKELTLRLADLLFEKAMHTDNGLTTDQLAQTRNRSIRFYQEALTGNNGDYPSVSGPLRLKVLFQLARLYTDGNNDAAAKPLWEQLVAQTQFPDLQREAALRLAEAAEKSNHTEEAMKYYRTAISLCGGTDVCSYSHYRLAWRLRDANRLPEAIGELELALYDSKGQVREEALRDYISFLSLQPGDGKASMEKIEALSGKLARPELMRQLAEAYFSAGNKIAGTNVLTYVAERKPTPAVQVRLLEEFYGLRQWDRFRETLSDLMGSKDAAAPGWDGRDDSEKILRRLTVQLDGERTSQPQFTVDFKNTVLLYLKIYPSNKETMKMREGWLAAETDPQVKLDQLAKWLAPPETTAAPSKDGKPAAPAVATLSKEDEIKLREYRATVAQKSKNYPVAAEELAKLAALTAGTPKSREYLYYQATALASDKQTDAALPILKQLGSTAQDSWTPKAQLLALDLMGQKKDYAAVKALADGWLSSNKAPAPTTTDAAAAPNAQTDALRTFSEQAEFEQAAGQGQTPAALAVFKKYCLVDKFKPKACDNARVLAVKLKDQPTLEAVLDHQGRTSELASEYEASGHFAESAKLAEKLNGSPTIKDQLKLALLYELGGDLPDRNRVLDELTSSLKKKKEIGPEEPLVYQTLKDSDLLDAASLKLPWSESYRLQLAEKLEDSGQGDALSHRIIQTSMKETGPAWAKMVLAEFKEKDEAQRRVTFYGKNGKRKFEARLKALSKLTALGEKYLPGSGKESRVAMAQQLATAHLDLAKEIEASPIPEGVPPEMLPQVKASLAEMAKPFADKGQTYQKLADEQKAKFEELAAKEKAEKIAEAPKPDAAKDKTAAAPANVATAAPQPLDHVKALSLLHTDPANSDALQAIRDYYEDKGQVRQAAYFKGRLLQLQKEGEGAK